MRDVAFSCDDNGAKFLCVTVWSLLAHYRGSEPLRINVFEGFGGHSSESKAKLKAIVGRFGAILRYHNIEKFVEPYKEIIMNRENSRWNIFTWTPIFTPLILADAVGPCIHFDIDMLFNADVSELFEIFESDSARAVSRPLIACCYEYDKYGKNAGRAIWETGVLPPDVERYFNTGVLVFNTEACRTEKTWEKIIEWYREHYAIADRIEQDAWNALYHDRCVALPVKWNFHDRNIKKYAQWNPADRYWLGNPPRECYEATLAPSLLHFWGPKKPWKSSHRPYRRLYHAAMAAVGQPVPSEPMLAFAYNLIDCVRLAKIRDRLARLPEPCPARPVEVRDASVTSPAPGFRDVVFACDDRGVKYLRVAVWSLLKHYRGKVPLRINILDGFGGHSEENREVMRRLVAAFPSATIRYLSLEPILGGFKDRLLRRNSRWNIFAWASIAGPDAVPDAVGNLLYLDIDQLVNADVSPLFEMDLGDDLLAAVYENHRGNPFAAQREWETGILPPEAERYFNVGTMVFNARAFREEKVMQRLIDWYLSHSDIAVRIDQDAFNALCWNRTRALPITWGFHDRMIKMFLQCRPNDRYWNGNPPAECLDAALAPKILHFMGRKKPWNPSHRPYRGLYHAAMRAVGLSAPREQWFASIYSLVNEIRLSQLRHRAGGLD